MDFPNIFTWVKHNTVLSIVMALPMSKRHQPKLVEIIYNKLKTIENCDCEEKFAITQNCLKLLVEQLVTFGPALKIIQIEYEQKVIELKKQFLIEKSFKEM